MMCTSFTSLKVEKNPKFLQFGYCLVRAEDCFRFELEQAVIYSKKRGVEEYFPNSSGAYSKKEKKHIMSLIYRFKAEKEDQKRKDKIYEELKSRRKARIKCFARDPSADEGYRVYYGLYEARTKALESLIEIMDGNDGISWHYEE